MASKKDMKPKNKVVRRPEAGKPSSRRNLSAGSSSTKKQSLIQDITNRYRVTAREARDIVTAVGTLGRTVVDKNIVPGGSNNSLAGKNIDSGNQSKKAKIEAATRNLVKQVRETGKAAATGKKGTSSAKVETDFRDRYGNPRGGRYEPAKKRTK